MSHDKSTPIHIAESISDCVAVPSEASFCCCRRLALHVRHSHAHESDRTIVVGRVGRFKQDLQPPTSVEHVGVDRLRLRPRRGRAPSGRQGSRRADSRDHLRPARGRRPGARRHPPSLRRGYVNRRIHSIQIAPHHPSRASSPDASRPATRDPNGNTAGDLAGCKTDRERRVSTRAGCPIFPIDRHPSMTLTPSPRPVPFLPSPEQPPRRTSR